MGRIWTRPRTPVAAQLLPPGRKAFGKVALEPQDSISRSLLHYWDFRNHDNALSDLAGRAAMQKNVNQAWESSPTGRGVRTGDYEGSNGPTVNVGTGDFTFVFNFYLLDLPDTNNYFGEIGIYNPGFVYRNPVPGSKLRVFWGSSNDFNDLEINALNQHICTVVTRSNGVLYAYLNGRKSTSSFSVGTSLNDVYTYNGGFQTIRIDRVDLALRIYSRAVSDAEARRFYEDLNAGLKPASDAPFRYSEAIPPATGEDNAILMASNF
jgi:hypothetical protein